MLMERAEVTGLELGQTYAARVRAVNAAGAGQWSLDSEKLVARHKALRPKVTFEQGGKEMSVKEGGRLKVVVMIEGEPAPEDGAFEINGNAVLENKGSGVSIKHAEYKSELVVRTPS